MKNKSQKIILVIDDSADNQALLDLLFCASGYQVYTASNGEEALCLLKELTELPHLILLDAQMPVMDGYQFRIEQGKDLRIKDIPVVVMTGDDDVDMSTHMNKPLGVLIKPLQIQTLMSSVNAYL